VIEAAGLTMDHVVYIQVYLDDISNYEALNSAFADYFSKTPPARAVLGAARLPEPPLQITAVAVRDLKGKQPIAPPNFKPSKAYSAGMLTHDRLFVSTMLGSNPSDGKVPAAPAAQVDFALDRLRMVAEAAGLTLSNMVFVNPYLTSDIPMRIMNEHYARRFEFGNTPARATIEVSSLPEGAHIAYTGVAVRDLSQRRAIRPKNMPPSPTASPCVFAGDTLYCSAKSGFIPGPNGGVFAAATVDQVRQTMRNQLDNLEEADMKFDADDEIRSGCFDNNLPRRFVRIGGVGESLPEILQRGAPARADGGSTDPACGTKIRRGRNLSRLGAGLPHRCAQPGETLTAGSATGSLRPATMTLKY
jgi:enamine deaminase RidA (YjgF/YER057c/UK114 family)